MKKGKLEWAIYSIYDHTTMEEHFEKMAMKGWAIDRAGTFWHYHRIEPKRLHYAIGYFPESGVYEPASNSELVFEDYCAEAGWNIVAEHGPMKIFCNENENPVPLETQADIQVENIHKASKKYRVVNIILAGVGCLLTAWFIVSLARNTVAVLASNIRLFIGLCSMIMGAVAIDDVLTYQAWYKKAKKNAENDMAFTPTHAHKNFQIAMLMLLMVLIVLYALGKGRAGIYTIAFFIVYGIVYWLLDIVICHLRKNKIPTVLSVIITFLVVFAVFMTFTFGSTMLGVF